MKGTWKMAEELLREEERVKVWHDRAEARAEILGNHSSASEEDPDFERIYAVYRRAESLAQNLNWRFHELKKARHALEEIAELSESQRTQAQQGRRLRRKQKPA